MDKMTIRGPLLLLVVLLVAAGPAFAQRGGDGAGDATCAWVATTTVEHRGDYSLASVSAQKSTDLVLTVFFPEAVAEDHLISLRLMTPRGHLYRQIDAPVTTAARANSPGMRRLATYPHPVPVRAVRPQSFAGAVYQSVDIAVPVAGTAIVDSSLYGKWTVHLFVDGVEQTCGEVHRFMIEE